MNMVTALPNAQVLLSPCVMDLYSDAQEPSVKALTWRELYQLLNSQPWRRMVKREQDGELDTLVLVGFLRIVKSANKKVTVQRLSLQLDAKCNPTWSWVRCDYVPNLMMQSCQSSLAWRFRGALEYAIGALIADLKKQGIDTLTVPVKGKKKGAYEGIDMTPVSAVRLGMNKLARDWVTEQCGRQFGFLEEGIKSAGHALYKHLWDFVDKEKLSLYLQIHQCALSEVSFGQLHTFSKCVTDVALYQQHRVWLPWLSTFPTGQYRHYAHPNLFSYEYLLARLPKAVSKGAIRKINRQPRQVQTLLIKARMWTAPVLSLLDALSGYPTTIQVRLLSRIQHQRESDYGLLQRIVFRWAQYFRPMIGLVKVRKQQAQWQRALTQFDDVLDWVTRDNGTVHKNQTWYALVQQHDRWIARINADRLKAEAEVDALTWEGAKWEMFDTQGVEIKEITTGRALRAEGIEMEHCVFSYLDDCVNQRYRVFSLIKDSERATLGVHLDEITHQCHYDQLRGKQNNLASKALEQVASRVIQRVNDEV